MCGYSRNLAEHFPRLTKIVTGLGIRSTRRRRRRRGPLWGIKKRMEEGAKGTASLLLDRVDTSLERISDHSHPPSDHEEIIQFLVMTLICKIHHASTVHIVKM